MDDSPTTADVMLRRPRTLPDDASVGEVRELLANPSVQLVLLTSGSRFRGAVAAIPDSARPDEPALGFAEPNPATLSPDDPASVAFARTVADPYRRVVVLDENDELVGLVCLDVTRTRFCGIDASKPAS